MSVIRGTEQSEQLDGTQAGDIIISGLGNDTIFGFGGDDNISAAGGDNEISSGIGDDYITTGDGDDTVFGGRGADVIYSGGGADLLVGGSGADTLGSGSGNDTVFGGRGNDEIFGGTGDNVLRGGTGNDFISIGSGANLALGGAGFDVLSFEFVQGNDAVTGIRLDLRDLANSSETVLHNSFSGFEGYVATQRDDTIHGSDRNDHLIGNGGSDYIHGHDGNDYITGSDYGQDAQGPQLFGGRGNDTIASDGAGGFISGGRGNDVLSGAGRISGGRGNDDILAQGATVYAGAGSDTITESYGHDEIHAGRGNDVVIMDGLHAYDDDGDIVNLNGGNDVLMVNTIPDFHAQRSFDGGLGADILVINWGYSLYNVGTGVEVVDFRTQENGSWLDMGDMQVRNFETVWYKSTAYVKTVHFGQGNDVYEGGFSDHNQVSVYGHGGDDFINSGVTTNLLYGGAGNDTIVADGGGGAPNEAFGGAGDDLLFSRYSAAGGASGPQLTGGAGADGFVFTSVGQSTNGTAAQILDFDVGTDWIGLNFYPYFGEFALNPMTTSAIELEATLLVDNADELVFQTLSWDVFDSTVVVTNIITYDRNTGLLSASADDGWSVDELAYLADVPYLTMDDFYGMSTAAQSGELSPFDFV